MTVYIHALREEGDRTSRYLYSRFGTFLSTPSARRATDLPLFCDGDRHDFYPRPPRGGRRRALLPLSSAVNFYPRPPRGGRHAAVNAYQRGGIFLSTPSARRATDRGLFRHSYRSNFYPRPPRGGRRAYARVGLCYIHDFYPRPPRGGRL